MRVFKLVASVAVITFFFFALYSCSSAKKEEKELDVDVDENGDVAKAAVVETDSPVMKKPAPKSGTVSPIAVINWQSFFKRPPTHKERAKLKSRLSAWKDSKTPEELIKKGRAEVALGRLVAAETAFRKLIRLDENNIEAQLELAAIYLRKRQLQKAFEFLAHVRDGINLSETIDRTFVFRYRYTLAVGYLARGERDRGHKVLSDLIALDKTFTPAYAALASSYLHVGKTDVAEFVAKRGIDRGKNDPSLYNIMGVISQRRRATVAAREWFNKALKASPSYAPALVNRGNLSVKEYEYDPAEQDFIKALKADPQNIEALVALGVVQKKTGRLKGAKASFLKAIEADPENALARFNLAVLLAEKLKSPNKALRLFNEVIQISGKGTQISRMAAGYISDIKDNRVMF